MKNIDLKEYNGCKNLSEFFPFNNISLIELEKIIKKMNEFNFNCEKNEFLF